MRKTIAARTALGVYWIGSVRNSRTIRHDAGGGHLGELALAAGIVDHLGLGRAAVDDERPGERRGDVRRAEADQVDVLVESFVVLAA